MNSSAAKPIMIDLNIGDQLTSISCGHIVVEFVKFIAYQRLQIPYSYQWLKQMVNKRKTSDEKRNESLVAERHFRVASTALENLDFIIKSLLQEISSASLPEEVCISLGASPIASKEVYRLLLPSMCHKPQCHSKTIASDQKIQLNVFKELVTSEELSRVFSNQLTPTNFYVMIKKKMVSSNDTILNQDHFTYTSGHRIPRSAKIIIIDFRNKSQGNITCCNDYQVFNDVINQDLVKLQIDDGSNKSHDYHEIESTDTNKWYQSRFVMKGFKDCVVNGSSVTNSWHDG
ncbi:mad1 and cdc20-bound-Mad2 binding domain-containing protein [Phthorimaea operculella]|nr:mad1 and cdc20-bound-Mad2 binding domain-containing protein [Phthorimaea operculella]